MYYIPNYITEKNADYLWKQVSQVLQTGSDIVINNNEINFTLIDQSCSLHVLSTRFTAGIMVD